MMYSQAVKGMHLWGQGGSWVVWACVFTPQKWKYQIHYQYTQCGKETDSLTGVQNKASMICKLITVKHSQYLETVHSTEAVPADSNT
jgi:hypothetical protein